MSKTILFAQQKGGAGKTTLLTQVAAALAARGRAVAVVDIDPQRSASEWFAVRPETATPLALTASENWRASNDIKKAGAAADVVLVDSPGTAEVLKRVAMKAADYCVIPCQPSAADVWACRATLALAEEAGLPHGVVLNRVPPRSKAADAAAAELAGMGAPVLDPSMGARSVFAEAFMKGLGVTEMAPRSRAAEEVTALVDALDGLITL